MAELNFENRTLFHGDNLEFLRGMNSETVHLIATDPPFNKNRDFHATPDSLASGARFQDRWSWRDDIHDDWLISIQRDYTEAWLVISTAKQVYGDDMGAFLCWLGVRLLEMHRVLRGDGSLYLHIDHTAHAWVKALMDAIFGRENFRNEIVWAYTGPGSPKMRQFNRKHDTLLWYAKGAEWTFNRDDVRVPHKKAIGAGGTSAKWAQDDDDHAELAERYSSGKIPETWWTEFSPVGRIKTERVGYPTQKPLALYERIIKASSHPDDIVLDPFAGCATTPVAAERLGRGWVAIDIWDGAFEVVKRRMEDNRQLIGDIPEIHYSTSPPPNRQGRNSRACTSNSPCVQTLSAPTYATCQSSRRIWGVLSRMRARLQFRPSRVGSRSCQPQIGRRNRRVSQPHFAMPAMQSRETRSYHFERITRRKSAKRASLG